MFIPVVNFCVFLTALFISYLISYYATESEWACTIFSAVFHYLFLATSLSLLFLVLFTVWEPERIKVIYIMALAVQIGMIYTCMNVSWNSK